jgi:putative polyketide hydroxylase
LTEHGGCVLVRPDGHVAWRMPWQPDDLGGAVTAALNQVRRGGTLA